MCPVKIFNENIAWTKETKYLGITLDARLTYRTHISCILRKANYRLRQMFPILNKSSAVDINLALIIFKSLLRSILTYINKLETFQNKVLRILTKLPRVTPIVTLHEQTRMSLIRSHTKKLTRNCIKSLQVAKTVRFRNLDNMTPSLKNICAPYPPLLGNPLGTANSHYHYPNIYRSAIPIQNKG
jgi:hypothetical protein